MWIIIIYVLLSNRKAVIARQIIKQIRFPIGERETLNFREGDKLYFTVWYEDPDYREETIVRSLRDGTILDRFSGDIRIMPNGEKWLVK